MKKKEGDIVERGENFREVLMVCRGDFSNDSFSVKFCDFFSSPIWLRAHGGKRSWGRRRENAKKRWEEREKVELMI